MKLGLRSRWRHWRDAKLVRGRPIPDELWLLTMARYPFLRWRSLDDLLELRRLATLFLAEKEFTGACGFTITDEIAVAVAAQACLPILRHGLTAYAGFVGIVMHADEVVAQRVVTDDDGIVHEYQESLSGEAMESGPVMLSWRDVAGAGASAQWGYNVVIHEFAHVLDMADGLADGAPPLPDRPARRAWFAVMEAAFTRHCRSLSDGISTLLDPYGAESIDEFFAVASECFFVAPHDLVAEHAACYSLLRDYYAQDPAAHAPR